MKCEACGGDGQIEYGAYRGDEAGPTRECRLCGGVITQTVPLETLGVSAQSASGGLQRLAQASSKAGLTLLSSASGTRTPETTITTERHYHQWSFHVKGHAVHFECINDCGAKMLFSVHGSLIEGKPVEPSEMQYLSRRATMIYESHLQSLKTAKEVANERLEQLRLENEQRQYEAEKHEHKWNHVQVTDPYSSDLISRRVQFRCVGVGHNCSKVLEFNTGGGLITEKIEIKEPQLSELALRARNAALKDKTQRRERGML